MGIVISGGATKFGCKRNIEQQTHLLFQTFHKNTYFLTQTRWRSWLSVGSGQHGDIAPFDAQLFQFGSQSDQGGHVYFLESLFGRKRNRGIVDVLGSQSEVDELFVWGQSQFFESVFDEIFHGFYVVVGHFFGFFDPKGIFGREVSVNVTQTFEYIRVDGCKLRQRNLAKCNEIFNFYQYAVFD